MADSLGPGVHTVKECATLGFADLGDVAGFEEPGHGVYGLLLTKDGHYALTPVQIAEPEWDINLSLKPSHIFLNPGKDRVLSHLQIAGRMITSYAPSGPNRCLAVVEEQAGFYIIKAKSDAAVNIAIKAATHFAKDTGILKTPPDGSTIYLEVLLGDASPAKWVEVLPGLKLQWDAAMMIALIIQKGKVGSTNPALITQLDDKGAGIEWFYIEPKVAFISLLFASGVVPDSYLNVLTGEMERLYAALLQKSS